MTELIDELVARSGDLKRAVLDFSQHPRFDRVFRHELRARFGRIVTGSEEELSNFFDWFIQEYRLRDGRTITETFADSKADLTTAELDDLPTKHSAGSLYLIWGDLTDWIDGPRSEEPGVHEPAIADMRRAASEWVEVRNAGDPIEPYLDRWLYDECGYKTRSAMINSSARDHPIC